MGSEKERVLGSLAGYHLFILQGRNEGGNVTFCVKLKSGAQLATKP